MNYELHCGDCLEVMPTLADGCADMILADLPYGTTACKWDTVIPFEPLWAQYKRLIKPRGAIVLFGSQPFTSALVMSNIEWFKHEWIWIKNRGSNFANTVREPFKEHESICVFSSGKWTYNAQMQERAKSGSERIKYGVVFDSKSDNYRKFERQDAKILPTDRVPSSWQKFNTNTGLHPTQKPVDLLAYLIRTYTNEGETVLDNTMGSGSTIVAAIQEGRKAIGIEKDEGYFKIAKERIEKAVNDSPLFAQPQAQQFQTAELFA